jgi:hypothetical protein
MAIWNILQNIWYILWPFGNLVTIWYIFLRFGLLCQEKSGNPGVGSKRLGWISATFCRTLKMIAAKIGRFIFQKKIILFYFIFYFLFYFPKKIYFRSICSSEAE